MRSHAGVVILAGRAPYTFDPTTPGSRDRPIQWQQDVTDQIGIVRGYVKWAHELGRVDTLPYLIPRAVQLAASEPAGPVYMTAAREMLMEPTPDGEVDLGPARRTRPLVTPPADAEAIEQLAEWLALAEAPLAIAGAPGRYPRSVSSLVELAELLGMPVADTGGTLNLPLTHPLHVSDPNTLVGDADVVLMLDVDVPWIPRRAKPAASTRLAQIDIDPLKQSMSLWGFPVDLPIQADSSKALPMLVAALQRYARAHPDVLEKWDARRVTAMNNSEKQRAAAAAQARLAGQRPIAPEWIGAVLRQHLPESAIVLDELVTNVEPGRRYLGLEEPGSLLTSGAPGLGWALGAAVGVKLASPRSMPIALVGDGTFIFGSPIAALSTAEQARTPFLTIIFNNGGYNASKTPVQALFPDGVSQRANLFPGVRFASSPDYVALARSCHAFGERVTEPSELGSAIERGLAAVRNGQSAVLDVVLAQI
jgi:acetolactate synthase-1/2/3 large subunit